MTDTEFLNAVLDDGIAELQERYTRPEMFEKRDGAIKAFEDCRGKTIEEIAKLAAPAQAQCDRLRSEGITERYWYWRYYVLQIEWVTNVFSAKLKAMGQHPTTPVTMRGAMKALDVLGRT